MSQYPNNGQQDIPLSEFNGQQAPTYDYPTKANYADGQYAQQPPQYGQSSQYPGPYGAQPQQPQTVYVQQPTQTVRTVYVEEQEPTGSRFGGVRSMFFIAMGIFFFQAAAAAVGMAGQTSGWVWSETLTTYTVTTGSANIVSNPNLYAGLNSWQVTSYAYWCGSQICYLSTGDKSLGRFSSSLIDDAKVTMIILGVSIGLSVIAAALFALGRKKEEETSPAIPMLGAALGFCGSILMFVGSLFYVVKAIDAFEATITLDNMTIQGDKSGPYPSWSFYFTFFGSFLGVAGVFFGFVKIRKALKEYQASKGTTN
eukprot:Nk52_evm21s1737 gene=Nk52_evmTU21s1737